MIFASVYEVYTYNNFDGFDGFVQRFLTMYKYVLLNNQAFRKTHSCFYAGSVLAIFYSLILKQYCLNVVHYKRKAGNLV